MVIASTSGKPENRPADASGGLEKRPVYSSEGCVSAGPARLPVVRLTRVDASSVFKLPSTSERKSGLVASSRVSCGSPPDTVRAQSSAIVISDEELVSDFSVKCESDNGYGVRASKPFRRRRGRPPTTGEWVGITEALEKYNAAKAVEMELDEMKHILNSLSLPKQTKRKQDLPSIEDLKRDLSDYPARPSGRGQVSLNFLDKLSDKSSGLNGRLKHDLRMASRNLGASVAELSDRAERHEIEVLQRNRANEYLMHEISRLRGELDIAWVEIASLRASVSPSGRSPPHKKARGLDDTQTRDIGTQMEVGREVSPNPVSIPLPVSPIIGREMIDRCCSPIWSADTPVVSASAGIPGGDGPGATPPESRDITALEQSLLDHIQALFAQRNSLQEDLGRIRKKMEDPSRDSILSAAEERPGKPKTPARARRKKTKKKRRKSSTEVPTHPLPPPSGGVEVAALPCLGLTSTTTLVLEDGPWSRVVGRRSRRAARGATALIDGPSISSRRGTASGPERNVRNKGTESLRSGRDDPSVDKKVKGRRELGFRLRPQTTAVVSVTLKPGAGLGYREVMAEARARMNLKALSIANSRIRQAVNGGVLIQIFGKDRNKLADDLADKMDEVLKDNGVRIGQPSKCAELRVRGVDIFATPDDIATAIANLGKCNKDEVRLGRIREATRGLGTV
ncbi:gag protein [Lasius niger]|uniref:Gag protein n=1 Tax=Lasius niger TaxID=67767 RepID=A0A0J7K6G0_LASNI|nr:gag protein [Lasius niger]